MITKFDYKTIKQASYDFDKYIENRTPIGDIMMKNHPAFIRQLEELAHIMQVATDDNIPEDIQVEIITPTIYKTLLEGLENLPSLLLKHDDINWTTFSNGIYTLLYNYFSLQDLLIADILNNDPDEETIKESNFRKTLLDELTEELEILKKFILLNVSCIDLYMLSNRLREKVRVIENLPISRTVQLSNSFLSAIGFGRIEDNE